MIRPVHQLVSLATLLLLSTAARSAFALPDGIVVEEYVDGLTFPVAMAMTPRGDILVTEKGGTVRLVREREVLDRPVVRVEPLTENERGLLGIALMPDFSSSGHFVITYTPRADPEAIYLSRYRLWPDGSATLVNDPWLELPSRTDTDRHYGGNVRFHDEKMYVALSDLDFPNLAQDRETPAGSILRFDLDLSIPADNPFEGSPIWAYGLRNTFDFDIASNGEIWGGENGHHQHDEVNLLEKGGNYGFPLVLGYCDSYPATEPCDGAGREMKEPKFEFKYRTGPTGTLVYEGGLMPELSGDVFVGGWHTGELHRFQPRPGDDSLRDPGVFFIPPEGVYATYEHDDRQHLQAFGIVDAIEANDGAILVLLSGADVGKIYRIAPRDAVIDASAIRGEGKGRAQIDVPFCSQAPTPSSPTVPVWLLLAIGVAVVLGRGRARCGRRLAGAALVATMAFAVPAESTELHRGARAGANLSTFNGDNGFAIGLAPGFSVGPVARADVVEYLGFGAELLYSLEGASNEFTDSRISLHYLSLPVLIEGILPFEDAAIRLNAGGYGGVLLSGISDGEDVTSRLNTLDAGFLGGLGLDLAWLGGRLTVDARFQRSVRNVYDEDATPDYLVTPTNFRTAYHVMLGFLHR